MAETKILGTCEATNQPGTYKTLLKTRQHTLITDEPVVAGGNDEGPSPGDYICMAIAACKTITLRMYMQRKQWTADEINVKVNLVKVEGIDGSVNTFLCEVSTTGGFTDEQKQRLLQIAKACPISKLLTKQSDVITVVK